MSLGYGGTGSQGKRAANITTIRCRRCGRNSYHLQKKKCSSCGYGNSSRLRSYNWATK